MNGECASEGHEERDEESRAAEEIGLISAQGNIRKALEGVWRQITAVL